MEHDWIATESESGDAGSRALKKERSTKVSDASMKTEMKFSAFEFNDANESERIKLDNHRSQVKNAGFDRNYLKNERKQDSIVKADRNTEIETENYSSLLSQFDDYVANDSKVSGISMALSYGFEVGDMVWGKVKSHPWWPGQIFNESSASSSVRRTRRPGYVLVAFYGDSSYGWFDPAELIPFDLHFAEKSQQTSSRSFVKAVEEAMDEVSRRRGLGLACKCRNPNNFRPANVPGYFHVDVPDFDPGWIYGANQISKARESFLPKQILYFLKQSAVAPTVDREKDIDFLKNKATVAAFRTAVYEEFDEPYDQAFGLQRSDPYQNSLNAAEQSYKDPTRAPLSGPLVIAEALGDGKCAKDTSKAKESPKKDKYLFKRRDEASFSASPPPNAEGFSTGDYVKQYRDTIVPVSNDATDSNRDAVTQDAGQTLLSNGPGVRQSATSDVDLSPLEANERGRQVADIVVSSSNNGGDSKAKEASINLDFHESGKQLNVIDGSQEAGLSSEQVAEGQGLKQMQDGQSPLSLTEATSLNGINAGEGVKRVQIMKRPLVNSENRGLEPKKKKKNETVTESISTSSQKKKKLSSVETKTAKPAKTALISSSDSRAALQRKNVNSKDSLFSSARILPTAEIPQLLHNLQAYALNPFYGKDRHAGGIVRHFFLRFRSLVFQKSLPLSPPSDSEAVEVNAPKSRSGASGSESIQDMTPPKPLKASLLRPDKLVNAGRKRFPSDRQEEIAAKRMKKINQMKSLAAEKKSAQRIVDAPKAEEKEQVDTSLSQKFVRPQPIKKKEVLTKLAEPTMLMMKFPPGTSLPSSAELKARFGRFGALDQSALRVFWKSLTCRVVYMHKADALTAYKYAIKNSSLFGNINVRYQLREVEDDNTAAAATAVTATASISSETKESTSEQPAPIPPQQPRIQLKSCLKKPSEDNIAGSNSGRCTPRVKFVLGEEESNVRGENQFSVDRNNAGGVKETSGPSVTIDYSNKNFQKLIPSQSPLPTRFPLPSQFAKTTPKPLHHHSEVLEAKNARNMKAQIGSSSTSSIDISQQMLSLLTRCNDVVTNFSSLLGYVPYQPL